MTKPNVSADLEPLLVPISELKSLEGNPRKGDVDAVAASYARFGQRKPIVAQLDGTVIAGNHQLAAARKLKWTHIAVVRVDDDDATAQAFALADNRTHDLGTYDDAALAALLRSVAESGDETLLAATGYDESDFETLTRIEEAVTAPQLSPSTEWEGMPAFEQENLQSAFHCVVHFASKEDADKFFKVLGRSQSKSFWYPEGDGHKGRNSEEQYVSVAPVNPDAGVDPFREGS